MTRTGKAGVAVPAYGAVAANWPLQGPRWPNVAQVSIAVGLSKLIEAYCHAC